MSQQVFALDDRYYSSLVFSGGEVHIVLNDNFDHDCSEYTIQARLDSSDAVMKLFMLTDAIRRSSTVRPAIHLFVPYFPYGRADRVMKGGGGDALGVRVMADLINAQGYESVTVLEPHSNVTLAVLDRCKVISFTKWANSAVWWQYGSLTHHFYWGNAVIVSPDKGARERAKSFADAIQKPLAVMDKVRDTATGKLSGARVVEGPDLTDKECWIADDLIDGGGTFILAAKALREVGASKVYLLAPHGILSKGITLEGIDKIYTSNSVKPHKTTENLVVSDVYAAHQYLQTVLKPQPKYVHPAIIPII